MIKELREKVFSITRLLSFKDDVNMQVYHELLELLDIINKYDKMYNIKEDDLK